MGVLDIFRRKDKTSNESNTLFGQTQLGNNVVYQGTGGRQTVSTQLLYVTTASNTVAGRTVDMSVLSRNSTVMACTGAKARALAQLPKRVICTMPDGTTQAEYLPQKYRVRGPNARYCLICSQVVDDQDDAEREEPLKAHDRD